MQGGAQGQFAAIPQNLVPTDGLAYYLNSGYWSKVARASTVCTCAASGYKRKNTEGQWYLNTPSSCDRCSLCACMLQ